MTRTRLLALVLFGMSHTAMATAAHDASARPVCANGLPDDASAESIRITCEVPAKYRNDVSIAEVIGGLIREHDLAAWRTTDALRDAHAFDAIPGDGRGWLTLQRDNAIDVRYFAESGGVIRAFAKATLRFDPPGVTDVARLATPEAMTGREARLMRAKNLVLQSQDWFVCNRNAPPNTALFEFNEDGEDEILVFVMTAWTEGAPPLTGHHMFRVNADGTRIIDHFSQSVACLSNEAPPANAEGLVVTHLTSAAPTMFHVFASLETKMPIYVVTTQNGLLWKVERGRIFSVDATDKMHALLAPSSQKDTP